MSYQSIGKGEKAVKNEVKLSVIVPVFNASEQIFDCVRSITDNSFPNYEIILADDGSTDGSSELCDIFSKNDPRIRVIHTKNNGAAAARNAALDTARGYYIAFVDADDCITQDYFETLINELEEAKADAICCNFVDVKADGRKLPVHVLSKRTVSGTESAMRDIADRREFYWSNVCCKIFRADAIASLRFPALRYGEDGWFMFDFLLTEKKLILSDYCGYVYNNNPKSVTSVGARELSRRRDEALLAKHKLDCLPSDDENVKRAFFNEYAKSINGVAYAASVSKASSELHARITAGINELLSSELLSKKNSLYLRLYKHFPAVYTTLVRLHGAKSRLTAKNAKKALAMLIPIGNVILLESYPCLTDSTKAVFDEMIRRGWNKKYRFYWVSSPNSPNPPKLKNVHLVSESSLRMKLLKARARVIVSSNRPIPKLKKSQYALFITHGAAIKRMRSYSLPEGIDAMIVLSEALRISDAAAHGFPPSRSFATGLPRNDRLLLPPTDTHKLFPDVDYVKLVYWLPTFRRHKLTGKSVSQTQIPLIRCVKDAEKINNSAEKHGILIIAKPHFADDVSASEFEGFSNLRFINEDFLNEKGIENYALLRSSDALITDYSSVYFDYLALDRPIGLIWEDVEEYVAREGLGINIDRFLCAGEKIYSIQELDGFFERLSLGIDSLSAKRRKLANEICSDLIGTSTERVTDRIAAKLNGAKK